VVTEKERPAEIWLEGSGGLSLLEESEDGMKVVGVALVDNAVSSNNRYYSAEFNDACMEATNKFMQKHTVSMFSRHGNAIGSALSMPTALPIGKITKPLYRQGNEIWYEGLIVDTTEGDDVMKLVRKEVMNATSIRANAYKSKTRKMNGRSVEELLKATIVGIDTTDRAGIAGAGIRHVLEEAPNWEETEMEWEKLTLESLKANRADLVEECLTEVTGRLADLETKLGEVTETYSANEEKVATLESEAESHESALAKSALELAIAKAAHIGLMVQTIYETLVEKVESVEDIEKYLPEARKAGRKMVFAGIAQPVAKGRTNINPVEDPEVEEASTLTEEQQRTVRLSR